ncbi:malonate decarboxylase holo-ACP synthase [Clostridium estertheticum]|uniref:malonate decarboxylase holo-ACP synthase n=1 Tax=Clostridium estertheticum TaxID=238834 RepID=UPI001CF5E61A|nr:malonate decarboxylase holo-ACP synthase [Clostridium estertheticum]MCB2308191.1 malonate decarboxylase holo-ACP synthase [Clostridium estertheticum]MCB2346230.1 malonate decarboxylase holo-ACP synthase [Clostridium estertheticum]MCB2349578.1 malonate decarboxylase holo-ACP synthase [Clostridium estertheticum]WAG46548.1 malonate decarboxylase holo-ACP synthase [Clostridium estertheticum]
MEIATHDLLRLKNGCDIIGSFSQPDWVDEALKRAPFMVVRRAPFLNNEVPVGIRGELRNERYGGFLLQSNIASITSPKEIVANKLWRTTPRLAQIQVFSTLDFVDEIFKAHGLSWGPTGSVGFELASKIPTAKSTSDLDIVIYVPEFLPYKIANHIYKDLMKAPVPVDAQLETPNGAVALEEYARGETSILLRTINGPLLVKNPWAYDKLWR